MHGHSLSEGLRKKETRESALRKGWVEQGNASSEKSLGTSVTLSWHQGLKHSGRGTEKDEPVRPQGLKLRQKRKGKQETVTNTALLTSTRQRDNLRNLHLK